MIRATVPPMTPVRPGEMSAIEHDLLVTSVSELYGNVLVMRFRGEHRSGTGASSDARLIEAWVGFGVTLLGPDALVIDFSGLRLGGPLPRHVIDPVAPNLEEGFPLYVVCPPGARASMAALPHQSLCDSLDEALDRIRSAGPWAIR